MVPRFPRTAPIALGILSLASCRSAEQRPSAVPNDAPATIDVPASRPESSTGTALPIDAGDVPLTALLESADWKRFKALWQDLDALDAPVDADVLRSPTIPRERSQALRDEVAALGPRMRTLVSEPVAVDVLARVTETRIDGLSGMHARLMMSHRAPFPGEMATANGVLDLEKRLDSLLSLRKQQNTDPELLRSALGAVREEIEFLGLVRSLTPRIFSGLPSPKERTIAQLQAALAQREAEAQNRGEPTQHIAELRNEVEQIARSIARARPTLESLVADLER